MGDDYVVSVLNREGEKVAEYLFGLHTSDIKYLSDCIRHLRSLPDFILKIYGSKSQDMDSFLHTFGQRFPEYSQWLKHGEQKELRWYPSEKKLKQGYTVDLTKLVLSGRKEDDCLFGWHFSTIKHLVTQFHAISTIYEFACRGVGHDSFLLDFFHEEFRERFPEYCFWLKREARKAMARREQKQIPKQKKGIVIKGNFGHGQVNRPNG